MSETAFFFELSGARLRARCVWGGLVIAVAVVLPYEVVDGHLQFFWELLGELSFAGRAAVFAAAVAGLVIAIAPRLVQKSTSLALVVVAALLSAALVTRIGAEAVRWDAVSLPATLTRRSAFSELALALSAAGAALAARPAARRPARIALVAGAAIAFLVYAWPARGEAPLVAAGRALVQLAELPFRYGLGMAFVALAVLGPGFLCFGALVHLKRPPTREQPPVTLLALFGLPSLLLLFVYRALLMGAIGPGMLVGIATALTTLARVALLAAAFEVLGKVFVPANELEPEAGLAPRTAAAIAFGVTIVVVGAQAFAARPPRKGTDWAIADTKPDAKTLFEEALPKWIRARVSWDARVRHESAATDMLALKNAAREATTLARNVDPALGDAIVTLTTESDDLDLAGRRWLHLVAAVNDANRAAKVPYYVDPIVFGYVTEDGIRRSFRLQSHAISAVHRVTADGKPFAALHVTPVGPRYDGRRLLGFSRDAQPFALVELGEIGEFEKLLVESAHAAPPRCFQVAGTSPANDACGAALAALVAKLGDGLRPAIERMTERHELQHRIDGPELAVVGPVYQALPNASDDFQERVNRELSAYVAELTAKDAPPALGVIGLAGFALGRRSAEHYVARLVLTGLTKHKIVHGTDVDRDEVAAAVSELAAEDEAALRARAASYWASLYGGRLADPVPAP